MKVINQSVSTTPRQPSERITTTSHSGRNVTKPAVTHTVTTT